MTDRIALDTNIISIIVAASLEAGCTLLYSEDMQDEQVIEGKLTIVNPFI